MLPSFEGRRSRELQIAEDRQEAQGTPLTAETPQYEPADDSLHHVLIDFVNVPPGMRSGLR
jgi:hypothetical protein